MSSASGNEAPSSAGGASSSKPPYPARLHDGKWWCKAHGRVEPCPMCSAMYGESLRQPFIFSAEELRQIVRKEGSK